MRKVRAHRRDHEARVKIAAADVDDIAVYLVEGVENVLESIKESMEGSQAQHCIAEFMACLEDTASQRERQTGASSASGSSNPKSREEWKTNKTDRLKAMLIKALDGKHGADVLSAGSTLHHKLSRSRLKIMVGWLKETPSSIVGHGEMWLFIDKVEKLTGKKRQSRGRPVQLDSEYRTWRARGPV
jgi:hypothetical protein